jgi:hypothetical protein
MSKKELFYFEVNSEGFCYQLQDFIDRIEDGEEKIILQIAKIDYGNGYGWCLAEGEPIEQGDGTCGKVCDGYKPRNKVSGRCIHHRNTYSPSGGKLILTKEGLQEEAKQNRPLTEQAFGPERSR